MRNQLKNILLLIVVLTSFCTPSIAQQQPVDSSSVEFIINALRNGDADQLSKLFNQRIELLVNDNNSICSRNQAKCIMSAFFANHKPTSVYVVNNNVNEGSNNVIGSIITEEGRFRLSFLTKQELNRQYIYQLTIEE